MSFYDPVTIYTFNWEHEYPDRPGCPEQNVYISTVQHRVVVYKLYYSNVAETIIFITAPKVGKSLSAAVLVRSGVSRDSN